MVFDLIRSVLGLGDSGSSSDTNGANRTDDGDPAAAGTDAAGSTGSMNDASTSGAAEPAEAAGAASTEPASGDADTDAETPDEAAAAGTDAAASTGSMTEEPPEDGAAEPAEAAGPTGDQDHSEGVAVEEVSGIGPAYAQRLNDAGIDSVDDLLAADPDELAEETDLSAKRISRWQERAEEA